MLLPGVRGLVSITMVLAGCSAGAADPPRSRYFLLTRNAARTVNGPRQRAPCACFNQAASSLLAIREVLCRPLPVPWMQVCLMAGIGRAAFLSSARARSIVEARSRRESHSTAPQFVLRSGCGCCGIMASPLPAGRGVRATTHRKALLDWRKQWDHTKEAQTEAKRQMASAPEPKGW